MSMEKKDYRADERPALEITEKGEQAIKPRHQPRSYQLTAAAQKALRESQKASV